MEPATDAEPVPEVGGEDAAPADAAGVDEGDAQAQETTEAHAGDTEVTLPGEEETQMAGDPEGAAVTGGPGEDAAEEPAAETTTRCVPSRAQPRRLCALPWLACAWRGGTPPR